MKKIIFSFFAVLLISGCTPPKEKTTVTVMTTIDVAKEEEAIKKVVQAALDAIVTNDYDAHAATWVHSPYIQWKDVVGWDSLSVLYQQYHNYPREFFQARVMTSSNFDIYINDNFASVFHDEHFEGIIEGEETTYDARPHKYLEMIEGEWKVITLF